MLLLNPIDNNHQTKREAWLVAVRSSAAAHVHSALSSELHPLITVQRSRQGSPEYAYLPGSLEAAQVSAASWQSITGHMGRAPEHLPATSFTWTTTPRRWAGEERRHPPLQWVMISLAVDFLTHISMLLVIWRAIHLQSGDSKQIYGNGPTLAGDRQLPQCVVLKQIPLPEHACAVVNGWLYSRTYCVI